MTGAGKLIEIQASAESATFSLDEFAELQKLAQKGVAELVLAQNAAVA
jgi:ribonuclease PH